MEVKDFSSKLLITIMDTAVQSLSGIHKFYCHIFCRAVIDIHFFSIRSLTFYFSIPIISIQFWRTALIEYFHMFHTIFVAGILRFSQWKDNEGFLYTFWLNTSVSLQNSY